VLDQFEKPEEAEEKRQIAREISPSIEKQFEIFML